MNVIIKKHIMKFKEANWFLQDQPDLKVTWELHVTFFAYPICYSIILHTFQ